MKKLLTVFALSALLLTSCGNAAATPNNPAETLSSESVSAESSDDREVGVYTADVDLSAIGGDGWDWDYVFRYDSIPVELIDFIGADAFDAWTQNKENAPHSMQTCIEYFKLTQEDVMTALDPPETTEHAEYLTVSDVEILCSGDQAAINRTFVSDYAALAEDGSIYTIFWLGEHDAADYAEALLTAEEVGKAIENCAALGFESIDGYVADAGTALAAMK